jgi:hypothetical protein
MPSRIGSTCFIMSAKRGPSEYAPSGSKGLTSGTLPLSTLAATSATSTAPLCTASKASVMVKSVPA